MQLPPTQRFNQALIQMAVLLYQVDRKVTLTEQEALDELVENLDWQSPISSEAFKTEAIYHARQALDAGDGKDMLKMLKDDLTFDAEKTMEVAYMITGVDGERSEDETELLHFLSHKLIAKALVEKCNNGENSSQDNTL